MTKLSRRDAGKLLLAGCAGVLAPTRELLSVTKIDSVVRGVQIGAQAYSFRDRPLDECIAAFREVGLGECELSEIHFQKANTHGPDLNQWRLDTPLSYFQEVRKKFDDAGVSISAYGYNISPQSNGSDDRKRLSSDPGDGLELHHDFHPSQYGPAHR